MDREFIESEESAQQDRERRDAYRAERAQDAATRRAAQEQAEATARRSEITAMLESRFLQAGGTAEEFAKAKDALIADHLRDAALRADDAARRALAASYQ